MSSRLGEAMPLSQTQASEPVHDTELVLPNENQVREHFFPEMAEQQGYLVLCPLP